MSGGAALGLNNVTDVGGDVMITAGDAATALGGTVVVMSGHSNQTSSGDVTVGTANAGFYGVSGDVA
eukprot:scaffold674802_cov57-Prasinocladus_malaysianus.AAC.1